MIVGTYIDVLYLFAEEDSCAPVSNLSSMYYLFAEEDSCAPVSNLSSMKQSGLSLSMASMYSGEENQHKKIKFWILWYYL